MIIYNNIEKKHHFDYNNTFAIPTPSSTIIKIAYLNKVSMVMGFVSD